MTQAVIIGGGPGGYEAALVAASLGGDVTLVERSGIGGAAVLTDCVPSKALIATARSATLAANSAQLGVRVDGAPMDPARAGVELAAVNQRVVDLGAAQSADIRRRLIADGVQIIDGTARLTGSRQVEIESSNGLGQHVDADVVLIATGARPRVLPDAQVDGERILDWTQIWNLQELPEHLIVVGSGVTGAEFAGAFNSLGARVTLVSSRDRVLPTEDADAADVVEAAFLRRGMTVLSRSRAQAVQRTDDGQGVLVTLTDGREVQGSHCLLAVGSVPNSEDLGLESIGVGVSERGYIEVDRVSRTSVMGVYAAGDVTGVLPLASVAAAQGRIAMRHAFGDVVVPLDLKTVASTVFTDPEIASVGVSSSAIESGEFDGRTQYQSLGTNPRSKMQGYNDGFVKVMTTADGHVAGGVIVAPRASDLIHSLSIAVDAHLTSDQLAAVSTVYPSMSGSISEAARRLHVVD